MEEENLKEMIEALLNQQNPCVITVRTRPGAAKTELTGRLADGSFKARVAAPAEHGKANAALLRFFEQAWDGVAAELLSGASDRLKRIRLTRRKNG